MTKTEEDYKKEIKELKKELQTHEKKYKSWEWEDSKSYDKWIKKKRSLKKKIYYREKKIGKYYTRDEFEEITDDLDNKHYSYALRFKKNNEDRLNEHQKQTLIRIMRSKTRY